MAITIEISVSDLLTEDISYWAVWLIISDEVDTWMLPVSAPATLAENELQVYFDANATALWALADEHQYPLDIGESGAFEAKGGAKVWYADNLGAKQLFELDGADLEAEIDDLVEDLFPAASAPNKKRMRLLLISLAYNDRLLVRRAGLLD